MATRAGDFRSLMLGRQLTWRKENLPGVTEQGLWRGVAYDHILPESKWTENLWPEIRTSLPVFLSDHKIQPHAGKHNLLSSWSLGASLYFPFGQTEAGRELLAGFLSHKVDRRIDGVTEVTLEFEEEDPGPGYEGPDLSTGELLGEKGGARGANQTSPDVGVRVHLADGREAWSLLRSSLRARLLVVLRTKA